jgi:hypothetical protein
MLWAGRGGLRASALGFGLLDWALGFAFAWTAEAAVSTWAVVMREARELKPKPES